MAPERVRPALDPLSGPVIDDAVFGRLVADLGVEHIGGVCQMFLVNATSGIGAVVAALAAGNAAEAADAAHRLKSSSGFLGARRLLALCAEIEARARAGLDGTGGVADVLAGELALASAELVRRAAITPERPDSAAAPQRPGS